MERRLEPHEDPERHQEALEEEYRSKLRALERRARRDVELAYDHRDLVAHESDLALLESDLFAEDTWLVFGLRRRDLLTVGAIGGAVSGTAIDIAVGGASLMAGAALGAVAGAAAGWWSSGQLARLRVIDQPLGGRLVRCGPSKNPNLPFVLLGRARHHQAVIARRTHAERGEVDLDHDRGRGLELESALRTRLARCFRRLADGDASARSDLAREIAGLYGALPGG